MFRKEKMETLQKRKANYDRVYDLHEKAVFLCYVNDAYLENYKGKDYQKLEGIVAKGKGTLTDTYFLFDCNGREKARITMEEFYLGSDSVTELMGGDKRVALYPKEQKVSYKAGDILCLFKAEDEEVS